MDEKLAEALKKKGENEGEGQTPPAAESSEPATYDEDATIAEAHALLKGGGLTTPLELQEIYGNQTPLEVEELYNKLRGAKKKESYLKKLRADKAEKQRGREEKEARLETAAAVETGGLATVPPELANIFGDKVPQRVLRMYGKLTDSKTKEAVIAQLTADEEKRKRREERRSARAAEIPPVSAAPEEPPVVPQAAEVPIEEEVSMQTADVDESGMRTPQYDRRKMQEEMDRLSRAVATSPEPGPSFEPEPEPEQREVDVPGEEREKLRVLLDKLERLSRDESNEQAARAESAETVSPSFAERSERLNERSAALDTEAVKRGWLGRVFHSLNEKWNKLSPLKKFGVTVAAGAGAAAFSWPAIFALLF